MTLLHSRILLTGAASGIGRATAERLASMGARLVLVDRDGNALRDVAHALRADGAEVHELVVDLCDLDALPGVVSRAVEAMGGLDVLVNNAGLLSFRPFVREDAAGLERLLRVNQLAPMLLARAAVEHFMAQGSGRVVNVGSIFGSIGFAWFSAYSASKFAMRGFSEALRRELVGTGVGVTYVAPRATRTPLANVFGRMAEATGMHLDDPEVVAARIAKAIDRREADVYVGFPECLFVRINALLPRFVDKALRKQDRTARRFAQEAADEADAPRDAGRTPSRREPAPDTHAALSVGS